MGQFTFPCPGCQQPIVCLDEYRGLRVRCRERDEEHGKMQRLIDANIHFLSELVQLVGSDGGFANRPRIREIGEELNRQGGIDLMRQFYYAVRREGPYFSQDIWHRIGSWEQ